MHKTRLQDLYAHMEDQEIQNLLITDPASIDYLINYWTDPGERLLALKVHVSGELTLYLNRLFPSYQEEDQDLQVVTYADGEPILEEMAQGLAPGTRLGIDKTWPSHFLLDLMALCPQVDFVQGSPLVDDLRSIKSLKEIDLMFQASRRNDQAMEMIIQSLDQGGSEAKMVDRLREVYAQVGLEGFGFEPIIAYGPNGADPHHITDQTLPQAGDSIVIDIGGPYKGYQSDMTRTVFYQEVSDLGQRVYETVLAANLAAIEAVRPGASFTSIDQAARQVIEEAGFGQYFTHRTGHSIGREVHEPGDVGPFNEDLLQVGNVFSIEPGIYLPGELGVRIEDLVVVTPEGCRVLNQVTKDLLIVGKEEG